MTNRERYKQAFSSLHSSGQFTLEVEEMEQIRRKHRKNIAVAAAVACAVVIGTGGTVYAADIGGIQQKISMWLSGSQREVDVTGNGENGYGGYTFTYSEDGETKEISGGGVSIDDEGNETWMSADEVAACLSSSAEIDVDEDGRVWIYYYDQKIDITDSFDENGACSLTLSHEDQTVHLEIKKDEDGRYSFAQKPVPTENGNSAQTETPAESTTSTVTTYYGITDGK